MAKDCLPAISCCNNMNVVRYYLAISVLARHFNVLTGEHVVWPTDYYAPGSIGGFFALSGFLAFRSYNSRGCRPGAYFANRARRLMPMYIFIILLCAIGLSLTSSLPAAEYFTSPEFWKYLAANACFLNFLQPTLPGVFESEAFIMPTINGAIWTMKVDLMLTLSVPIVHYLYSRCRWNKAWLFAAIIALSLLYRILFSYLYLSTGNEVYHILGKQFFGQLAYFYIGVAICFFYDGFMRHKWVILAIILPIFLLSKLIPYFNIYLDPIIFAPLVIWVSMVGSWGYKISKTDNVSYGIYLYHFPIIQLGIWLGMKEMPSYLAFITVILVTSALSFAAWKLVGSRFVKK